MIVRGIVDAAGDAANFPVANETAKRHSHGTRITEIGKVVWREGPATAHLRNAEGGIVAEALKRLRKSLGTGNS